MKQNRPDSEFVKKVRHALERSTEDLDPTVTTRLNQARQRALQLQRKKQRVWLTPQRWLPAAAIAAASILFVVLLHDYRPPESHLTSGIEDVEILASSDNPDFFQELDFYTWLAEEMDRAG